MADTDACKPTTFVGPNEEANDVVDEEVEDDEEEAEELEFEFEFDDDDAELVGEICSKLGDDLIL